MTTEPAYDYPAEVLRWVDGDTVDLRVTLEERTIDHGFHIHETRKMWMDGRFRLYGIDTPERGQPNHDEARILDESIAPAGTTVRTQTYKAPDKYGRWLATLTATRADGSTVDVAAELLENKMAVPYFGGKKA